MQPALVFVKRALVCFYYSVTMQCIELMYYVLHCVNYGIRFYSCLHVTKDVMDFRSLFAVCFSECTAISNQNIIVYTDKYAT